jgi:hypothetical protein
LLSPLYCALTEVVPAGSVEVVIEATPFATLAFPTPEKVTVPVAATGVTVAVNVTD